MTSGLSLSPSSTENRTANINGTINGTSTVNDKVLIKNHPIYYFPDGSLILDVETQRFRVHHTLVTRHSRYLSSAADVEKWQDSEVCSSNEDGNGNGIGRDRGGGASTPLNHVCIEPSKKIRAEDVEALLKHLYHDIRLEDKTTSLSHIISLLRISSPPQLDFPQIHKTAREIFEGWFPTNPEEFTHAHPERLYEALPVAKEFGIRAAMKAIFYSLVSTTEFDVSEEATGDDGSADDPSLALVDRDPDIAESNPQNTLSESSPPALSLSAPDAQTCLALMTALIAHFTPILFTAPAASHMECTDIFAGNWMPLVIQPAIEGDGVYRPLETLKRIREIDWEGVGLCKLCAEEKREEWKEEQRVVWRGVDGWLGFMEEGEGRSDQA